MHAVHAVAYIRLVRRYLLPGYVLQSGSIIRTLLLSCIRSVQAKQKSAVAAAAAAAAGDGGGDDADLSSDEAEAYERKPRAAEKVGLGLKLGSSSSQGPQQHLPHSPNGLIAACYLCFETAAVGSSLTL
jgi:hypothetical protein